jgi:hypothetical protein
METKPDPIKAVDTFLEMDGEIAPQYSYFYVYSPGNQAYLWQQGVREIVGKKSDWAKVKREPIPRAERYHIWVPKIIEQVVEVDDEVKTESRLVGWRDVPCICTLSQTTGEPLEPKPLPGWSTAQALEKLGMHVVPFTLMNGNIQGYASGVEIAISPIAADSLKSWIHEMGHIVCGHTLEHGLDQEELHRGMKEAQAETVAYVVLTMMGVMTEQRARYMRGYLRHWLREEKPPESVVRRALAVADKIFRAGLVTQERTQDITQENATKT